MECTFLSILERPPIDVLKTLLSHGSTFLSLPFIAGNKYAVISVREKGGKRKDSERERETETCPNKQDLPSSVDSFLLFCTVKMLVDRLREREREREKSGD